MAQEAQAVDGVPVVVVNLPDDKIRRRIFITIAAAEKAAQRARSAGRRATLILCELHPLPSSNATYDNGWEDGFKRGRESAVSEAHNTQPSADVA